LSTVIGVLDDPVAADEQLGLHLWARLPTPSRQLVLWASSDRSWRDPSTLQPVPIERPTRWVCVEGFCTGTPLIQDVERQNPSSRWNFVRAIPVDLNGEPWLRLPVGVLTFASTKPRSESRLAELPPELFDEIREFLVDNAAALLTPES
jgi:hypothetical protein